MTEDRKASRPNAKATPQKQPDRLAREAAALRANLLKRKQQARARERPTDGTP